MRILVVILSVAACSGSAVRTGNDGGADLAGSSHPGDLALAPHTVGKCDSLPAANRWEEVTPPEVRAQLPGPSDCVYGVGAFVVDPSNYANLYLGTCEMGVWKSSDCGASCTHVNSGKNGGALDHGRQWTFVIDPVDPQVLYTNSGYNNYVQNGTWDGNGVSGLFKSTNGGVDWSMIWPPADMTLASAVQYNFVGQLQMDPLDHLHLLVSFHAACNPPHSAACVAESHDGGGSWTLVDLDPSWVGGESQMVWFLEGSQSWLWGSSSNGLWRTTNGGGSWQLINKDAQGHASGQLVRAKDGTFYLAANGIWRSPDGSNWSMLQIAAPAPFDGLATDGTTLFAASGFPWGPGHESYEPFWSSPQSDGQTWTQLTSPMLTNGGELAWDADHHVLYSSNEEAGFYRVVLP